MTKKAAIRNVCAILGGVLLFYLVASGPVLAYAGASAKCPETIREAIFRFYRPLLRSDLPLVDDLLFSYRGFWDFVVPPEERLVPSA